MTEPLLDVFFSLPTWVLRRFYFLRKYFFKFNRYFLNLSSIIDELMDWFLRSSSYQHWRPQDGAGVSRRQAWRRSWSQRGSRDLYRLQHGEFWFHIERSTSGADANSTDTDQGQPQPRQTGLNLRVKPPTPRSARSANGPTGHNATDFGETAYRASRITTRPRRLLPLDDSQINRLSEPDRLTTLKSGPSMFSLHSFCSQLANLPVKTSPKLSHSLKP